MDGQIEVVSTLGQGSEFRLAVPLTLGNSATRPRQTLVSPGFRVLMVARHPVARPYLT